KTHLHPVPTVEAKQVARLLADLDSERFATRNAATKELAKLGEAVEGDLRKVLQTKPPLELRQRVEGILKKLEGPEKLRNRRALELLEWMGSDGAEKLLAELAQGQQQAWFTRQAKASLDRLKTRKAGTP